MGNKCKHCRGTGKLYYPAVDTTFEADQPTDIPELVQTKDLEPGFCAFCSGSGRTNIKSDYLQP